MLAHWQAATLSYKLHKFGGFVFVFNGGIATLKQTPARKHQLKYFERVQGDQKQQPRLRPAGLKGKGYLPEGNPKVVREVSTQNFG